MASLTVNPNKAYSLIRKNIPHLLDPHGLASVFCCRLAESGDSVKVTSNVSISVDKYGDCHEIKLSGDMESIKEVLK